MMKYYLIAAVTVTVCLAACKTQQQKAVYEFPAAMSETTKAGFTQLCEKGRVLYDINCATCHNVKVKGRPVIPDFTQEQLHEYELRISNPQHESKIPDTKVTTEELGNICFFLTYKKKSNMPFKTSHVDSIKTM